MTNIGKFGLYEQYKSIRVLVIFAMTWANDNGPKEYNMKKAGTKLCNVHSKCWSQVKV